MSAGNVISLPDARMHAVRANRGRWTTSAVAAALALPLEWCASVAEWSSLMDRLDAAIEVGLSSHRGG